MQVKFEPSHAHGTVAAPPSKSMAHRLLICAALAKGESHLQGISDSEDILATIDCLRALGATIHKEKDCCRVEGILSAPPKNELRLHCRESGSTLRFLIPLALSLQSPVCFEGSTRLMERPQDVYKTLCDQKGWTFSQQERSITVCGALSSGEYWVKGNVSSQFISGLLFALPLAEGDSYIRIVGMLESKAYVDMTLQAMRAFGVSAHWENDGTLSIKGGQSYCACDAIVEGDYSNAAFLQALHYLGADVSVTNLKEDSLQGDRVGIAYLDIISRTVPTLSLAQCPDLGPILFALAAAKNGALFTHVERLRLKESDRISTMIAELEKFGTKFEVTEDSVRVIADQFHAPAQALCGHNDHRVVMALSVLLSKTGGTIVGTQAVSKSYPAFFDDLLALGVRLHATD